MIMPITLNNAKGDKCENKPNFGIKIKGSMDVINTALITRVREDEREKFLQLVREGILHRRLEQIGGDLRDKLTLGIQFELSSVKILGDSSHFTFRLRRSGFLGLFGDDLAFKRCSQPDKGCSAEGAIGWLVDKATKISNPIFESMRTKKSQDVLVA